MKTPEEEMKDEAVIESEESINITENQQEGERERTREARELQVSRQKKSIMQRIYDGVFGEDEFKEEREEVEKYETKNRRR